MSPEERQLLTALFDRTRDAAATPRDRDAEQLIDRALRDQPSAPYYLAQAVIVQEKGLEAAAARIEQLEAQLRRREGANRNADDSAEQGGFLGSLGSLFGGGRQQPAHRSDDPFSQAVDRDARQGRLHDDFDRNTPPSPQQPGGWRHDAGAPAQQGPWGQQQASGAWSQQTYAPSAGGGFLQGALGTAAGVAGGMLLANSLSGLFDSHMSSLGLGSSAAAATPAVEETVINNYYGDDNKGADSNGGNDGVQQADFQDDSFQNDGNDDVDNAADFGGDDSFDV